MGSLQPFRVAWTEAGWAPVRELIRAWRMPPTPPGAGWSLGCDPDYLQALVRYWAEDFDLAACVARLNALPQFTVEAGPNGERVHFVHLRGESEGRRPLLICHGWPGSVLEFYGAAERLAFPTRHGGRAEDAFDLVIPSLPGFGCSPPITRLVSSRETAVWFDRLMRERLGYDRYFAQAGDFGASVVGWLGVEHGASLRGLHLNMMGVSPAAKPETEAERAWAAGIGKAQDELGAYLQLQGTKPNSLAYLASGNPVGQAAWILERFHDWADLRERPFEAVFDRDHLLDNVMLYAMTGSFNTASWFYAAARQAGTRRMPDGVRVTVPTGFAAFPDPRAPPPPRSWVEKGYDVVRWAEPKRGGHFAALEAPETYIDEVRAFARAVDASTGSA